MTLKTCLICKKMCLSPTILTVILYAATIVLTVMAAGCSMSLFDKDNVIYQEGQHNWVKIKAANEKLIPLDHPADFTAEDMETALSSLVYFKPGAFSVTGKEGDEYDLFKQEEIEKIAGPLARAFSKAGSEEWVDFSVYNFRGPTLLGNFVMVDGVMFVKDGELNIALRNMAVKAAPDTRELNTLDPTKGYNEFRRIVPQSGQQKVKKNWVSLDLESIKARKAQQAEKEKAQKQTPKKRPAKERLKELQELYDEGLITEEEYNKKRKEILEEL